MLDAAAGDLLQRSATGADMGVAMFPLRILVAGDVGVGKSALSVRYLTKRYLGEYLSNTDVLYRCAVEMEADVITLEILDSSTSAVVNTARELPETDASSWESHITWSDGVIVMYSIINRKSFHVAQKILQKIRKIKLPSCPIIVLGNKRDIKHRREVSVGEGTALAEEFGSQFFELSTAENDVGVSMAFDSLLREAQDLREYHLKNYPRRPRTTSLLSVSKMLGAMFGKPAKKKRPCLSL